MYKVEFDDEDGIFDLKITKDGENDFCFQSLVFIDLSVDPELDLEQSNIEKLNEDTKFVLYEDTDYDIFSARYVYAQYSVDSYDEAVELAKKDLYSHEMQQQLVKNWKDKFAKQIYEDIESFTRKMHILYDEIPTVKSALSNQCVDGQKWAEDFCDTYPFMDKGLMIGWFANAIEAGKDYQARLMEEK